MSFLKDLGHFGYPFRDCLIQTPPPEGSREFYNLQLAAPGTSDKIRFAAAAGRRRAAAGGGREADGQMITFPFFPPRRVGCGS